jgi:hypothetical protein
MKSRLSCSRPLEPPVKTERRFAPAVLWVGVCVLFFGGAALAADAPSWMHALVNAPTRTYDEKTDAVLMYSQTTVTVVSTDKLKKQVREVYKILRPSGREYGTVVVYSNSHRKITSLHGWCIPTQGKDYEVKDKDALEVSLAAVSGSELMSDVRERVLRIPAPDPGNIVGYEYEVEEQPLLLQDVWDFQSEEPVQESHYSLQLPSGWEYRATWLNHPETKPAPAGSGQWQWSVHEIDGIRKELEMPPLGGVAGQMIVSFFPSSGPTANGFSNWQGMGDWYRDLTLNRRDASEEIRQKVAGLTAGSKAPLAKMRTLAEFVQSDIRYVAIELGIGGYQPHPAQEIFLHHYGDCKDKATLLGSMLHEIGVDSYYVVINNRRGSVGPATPAQARGFNHAILAIKIPDGLSDASLVATMRHKKLGIILFFDPTDELTPFGQLSGQLQSNYGLLVGPDGGELVQLPQEPSILNSIERTAKFSLDENGKLIGEVEEIRLGDHASSERWQLRTTTKDADRIKPLENILAGSLSSFRITRALVTNLHQMDQPFGFNYSFESENYAKSAGTLLLVRPRVFGIKSSGLLETKEPRKFAIEFEAPSRDTDTFEIKVPPGYEVDDLPPPTDADYSFASYHSKTEASGSVIRYVRTFEIKELSVPATRAEELKKFYRIIAADERSTVVLKPAAK